MRAFLFGAVALAVLSWARPAHAQFQNHSIGLGLGYLYMQPDMKIGNAGLPPALALDATVYMESGIDVGLRFGFAIQTTPSTTTPGDTSQTVVLYPAAMMRYFLWQDYFRPYVGVNLEFVHSFSSDAVNALLMPSDSYVGLAPTVGFEYFFAEDWSIGLNGEFAGYFGLNAGAHYSAQLWARIATHF